MFNRGHGRARRPLAAAQMGHGGRRVPGGAVAPDRTTRMLDAPEPPTSFVSFEEARARAAAQGYPLEGSAVRESERWWFFPVRQIGCRGVIVDKRDGSTTALGSAHSLDDWLWGYDAGLFRGEVDVVDLVVTEVFDRAAATAALEAIGLRGGWHLRELPVRFPGAPLWMRLPALRALDQRAMRWHLERP